MEPCYFCEIIEGNSDQWNVINRNAVTITLLNARQYEIGQCVVLPIRHAPTILDLSEHELSAVMTDARQLTQVMMKEFAPDGVLLYQNNGTGSGQEVPHFHLHVVPRRAGSDWGLGPPHIARLNQDRPEAQFDHEEITESKCETAKQIGQYFESN